jgi:hypothetical protein
MSPEIKKNIHSYPCGNNVHPRRVVSSGRNGIIFQGSVHALDLRLEDEARQARPTGKKFRAKIQWQSHLR